MGARCVGAPPSQKQGHDAYTMTRRPKNRTKLFFTRAPNHLKLWRPRGGRPAAFPRPVRAALGSRQTTRRPRPKLRGSPGRRRERAAREVLPRLTQSPAGWDRIAGLAEGASLGSICIAPGNIRIGSHAVKAGRSTLGRPPCPCEEEEHFYRSWEKERGVSRTQPASERFCQGRNVRPRRR